MAEEVEGPERADEGTEKACERLRSFFLSEVEKHAAAREAALQMRRSLGGAVAVTAAAGNGSAGHGRRDSEFQHSGTCGDGTMSGGAPSDAWQWEVDAGGGSWKAYPSDVQAVVEACFLAGEKKSVKIKQGGRSTFVVNVRRRREINIATGHGRNVRRVLV